jgi:branched-subunit amino acid transport protein
MTEIWVIIVVVGVATVLFKAAGPVFVGSRVLPERVRVVVELLAPVLLTSLIVTQTFAGDGGVTLDARVPGVAVGALAVWRRVPLVLAMVIAAVVTAALRAVGVG